jgi:hypothetical protein
LFSLDKRYFLQRMNRRDGQTRNRLHIYRRPCCTECSVRTQIRTARWGPIPIPWCPPQSVPRRVSRACPPPV